MLDLLLLLFILIHVTSVSSVNDAAQHTSMVTKDNQIVLIWRIQEKAMLVVTVDKTTPKQTYFPYIEEALELIEQGTMINIMISFIDQNSTINCIY